MSAARVLVVDDEPVVLQIVGRMLSSRGYEVFPAEGPRQALDIVKGRSPIDLVVSEIHMPEMRGPDLVGEVARISPQTARILMTGDSVDADSVPDGIQILRKPFTTEALIATVQDALQRSAKLRAGLACSRQQSIELHKENRQVRAGCRAAVRKSRELVEQCRADRDARQEMEGLAMLQESVRPAPATRVLTPREIE